jgi:hypothetical protein
MALIMMSSKAQLYRVVGDSQRSLPSLFDVIMHEQSVAVLVLPASLPMAVRIHSCSLAALACTACAVSIHNVIVF